MHILALDTTTERSSVAISDGIRLLAEYNFAHSRDLSRRLMLIITDMLRDCGLTMKDLGGVAVSTGPGSFTGLRIGVVTAKSLAQALNIPIVGVSSLDLLAHQFDYLPGQLICPVIRVRKGEVYTALYRSDAAGLQRTSGFLAEPVEDIIGRWQDIDGGNIIFCGDAVAENADTFKASLRDRAVIAADWLSFPKASVLARLASERIARCEATDYSSLVPFYIRKSTPEIRLEAGELS